MSFDKEKIILNLAGALPEGVEAFFDELNIKIIQEISELEEERKKDLILALVSSNDVDIDIPKLSLNKLEDNLAFFKNSGKGTLNYSLLKSDIGRVLIKRFLRDNSSLSFDRCFDTDLSKSNSLKVVEPLSIGYYSDIVATDACEQGFDFISLRNYLNNVMTYLSYLGRLNIADFPLELDYGVSKDSFIIQMHTSVENYSEGLLYEAFDSQESTGHPYKGLLHFASRQTDVLDIYFLEKTSRLVMTGIWFKKKLEFSTILLNNIQSFTMSDLEGKRDGFVKEIRPFSGDREELSNRTYSGEETLRKASALAGKKGNVEKRHLVHSRRVIDFIKKKRMREESPVSLDELDYESINEYLSDYPNQKMVKSLNNRDRDLIIQGLQDDQVYLAMEESINNAPVEKSSGDYLESVVKVISSLSMEEADEIVIVGAGEESDKRDIERVRGWLESEAENTIVSGSREELNEDTQIISGENDQVGVNEKWAVKRQNVVEKVKETITILKEEGKDLADIDKEIVKVIHSELKIDEDECKTLVKGILDNAVEPYVEPSLKTDSQGIFSEFEKERLEKELEKREEQIIRMKRLMDTMKKQLALKSGPNDSDSNTAEKALEQAKEGHERLIESKDKEIEALENRVEDLLQKQLEAVGDESTMVQMRNLEAENKVLTSQLDLANKRITTMSETIERKSQELHSKQSDEVENLKRKNDMAQTTLYKFKEEKSKLEAENRKLGQDIKQLEKIIQDQEDSLKEKPSEKEIIKEVQYKDKEIGQLADEFKKMETQFKAANLKNKQLEQKNKFLSAQLEEANRKSSKKGKETKSASADGKLNLKVKQLETSNAKLTKSSEKAVADLAEKKKEAVKLRSENTTLKNKINELERKLASARKKAA